MKRPAKIVLACGVVTMAALLASLIFVWPRKIGSVQVPIGPDHRMELTAWRVWERTYLKPRVADGEPNKDVAEKATAVKLMWSEGDQIRTESVLNDVMNNSKLMFALPDEKEIVFAVVKYFSHTTIIHGGRIKIDDAMTISRLGQFRSDDQRIAGGEQAWGSKLLVYVRGLYHQTNPSPWIPHEGS